MHETGNSDKSWKPEYEELVERLRGLPQAVAMKEALAEALRIKEQIEAPHLRAAVAGQEKRGKSLIGSQVSVEGLLALVNRIDMISPDKVEMVLDYAHKLMVPAGVQGGHIRSFQATNPGRRGDELRDILDAWRKRQEELRKGAVCELHSPQGDRNQEPHRCRFHFDSLQPSSSRRKSYFVSMLSVNSPAVDPAGPLTPISTLYGFVVALRRTVRVESWVLPLLGRSHLYSASQVTADAMFGASE